MRKIPLDILTLLGTISNEMTPDEYAKAQWAAGAINGVSDLLRCHFRDFKAAIGSTFARRRDNCSQDGHYYLIPLLVASTGTAYLLLFALRITSPFDVLQTAKVHALKYLLDYCAAA